MKKHLILPILALIFICSCNKENDVTPVDNPKGGDTIPVVVNPDTITTIKKESINGLVQKGPFISGTSITVNELDTSLYQTGKVFNSQITDNKGSFEIRNIELVSNYISIRADGFYFNEISGETSGSQLTLYALSDVSEKSSVNVNILSHLEKPRVEYLIAQGLSFKEAKAQAQNEVLNIFEIKTDLSQSSELLDISTNGEENAILLAVSTILQGFRSESELTELLSNISTDLKEDGILNSSSTGSKLINQAIYLDTNQIKSNLISRYNDMGVTSSIPNFGKHLTNFINETKFEITESFITYPDNGLYGPNVLSLLATEFSASYLTDVSHDLSFAAELPEGASLKIKISIQSDSLNIGDSSNTDPLGGFYTTFNTNMNWLVADFDYSTNSQTFTAIESGKNCDILIILEKGTFLIEYFEMNATTPTHQKTIIAK